MQFISYLCLFYKVSFYYILMKYCQLLKKQLNNDFIKSLLIKRQAWLVGFFALQRNCNESRSRNKNWDYYKL